MYDDGEYYSRTRYIQISDAHEMLDCVLEKMSWTEEDVVMDIGCGSGDSARDILLPRIPRLKTLIGVDILPNMIEFARTKKSHEKMEYHLADVTNWSSLEHWQGIVTKVFSIYTFHWLKDHRQAFGNIFKLLPAGGEAALCFLLSSLGWDSYSILKRKPKWAEYLKDADLCIPSSHYLKHGENYYRDMLKDVGFEVITCTEQRKVYTYRDDSHFKEVYAPHFALYKYIPDGEKQHFMDDFLEEYSLHCGRESNGKLQFIYSCLMVHVKKISKW